MVGLLNRVLQSITKHPQLVLHIIMMILMQFTNDDDSDDNYDDIDEDLDDDHVQNSVPISVLNILVRATRITFCVRKITEYGANVQMF